MALHRRAMAFFQGNALRSIGVLVGGTAAAHCITAIAMPISTRLFTPEDFSAASVFSSLVGIFVVVACLRFDVAVSLPEADEEAVNLVALSAMCALGAAGLLSLAIAFIPDSALLIFGQPTLLPYLWLLPAAILMGGLYLALQMWFVRRKGFGAIARSRIVQSSAAATGQIGLGVAGYAPLGLIVGQMLNYGAGSVTLAARFIADERALLRRVSLSGMAKAFKAYERFPRYSIWEALANAASIYVPLLLIASLADGPEAGYLTLAIFLLQAPMALIGTSVGQVYLSGAPEAMREGRIAAYTTDMVGGLVRTVSGPLVFLAIVSPSAFDVVFGQGWTRSGILVAWMTPWFLMQFLSSPVSTAVHVTGRQRTAMVLQLGGLALRAGSVAAAAAVWPRFISEAYALSGFLFYAVYLVVILRVVGAPARSLAGFVRPALLPVGVGLVTGLCGIVAIDWARSALQSLS